MLKLFLKNSKNPQKSWAPSFPQLNRIRSFSQILMYKLYFHSSLKILESFGFFLGMDLGQFSMKMQIFVQKIFQRSEKTKSPKWWEFHWKMSEVNSFFRSTITENKNELVKHHQICYEKLTFSSKMVKNGRFWIQTVHNSARKSLICAKDYQNRQKITN